VKTALTAETIFKTKLKLYIDGNELKNIITSHFVLALKAISTKVMLAQSINCMNHTNFSFVNFFGT